MTTGTGSQTGTDSQTGTGTSTSTDGTGSSTTGSQYACDPVPTTGGSTDTGTSDLCNDDPEFTASWDAWRSARATEGGCYFYTTSQESGFIDGLTPECRYHTTVIVAAGVVVERRFERAADSGDDCAANFVETGAAVGTTQNDIAAPAVTLDEVYAACCTEVLQLQPAEEYDITFGVDEHGWIKTCWAYPLGCVDGCSQGPYGPALSIGTLQFGLPD